MSLYDKISVGLGSGAGTKTSKLYSLLPVNGNGDFTFTRNTTAYLTNKDGLLESVAVNIPRWDYSKSDCPSLLLEKESTNLISWSDNFSDASWFKNFISLGSRDHITPDGSFTTFQTKDDPSINQHYIFSETSTVIGNTYTFSCYLKEKEIRYAGLGFGGFNELTIFDLHNGIIDTQGVNIVSSDVNYSGNGWYRCNIVFVATVTTTIVRIYNMKNKEYSYAGADGEGVYIWGSQCELLSYPTSYIKTIGTALTRDKDEVNGSGTSAEFNGSSGVLYTHISALQNDLTHRIICISDGSLQQRIFIAYNNNSNTINCRVYNTNVEQANFYYVVDDITKFHKIALTYKLNEFNLWVDGVKVAVDTSGIMPTGLTDLSFNQAGSKEFFGYCKEVIVFKESLTDEELIKLTT